MKLYALLIGINDYPVKPLKQCVADAGKMETYLNTLTAKFEAPVIKKLVNAEATRENVIDGISNFLSQATDEDVALIYYSGHGALEESAGIFPDDQDGLLESMVCYGKGGINTSQFLADKELRYLLSKLKSNPHLVTIFDACHSGDIVRAFHPEEDGDDVMKRIAGAFPARDFNSFVFAQDLEVVTGNKNGKPQIELPYKNHVHLAACLASESSWEDSKGGVFTRYLIGLLEATQGNLQYNDIARWAKISLKTVTEKNQTPTITVQGEGKMESNSQWLELHPKGSSFPGGAVKNNPNTGWIYTRGALLGVEAGMNVIISLDNKELSVKVKDVSIDESILDVPPGVRNQLDPNRPYYPARTEITTYSGLKLFINEIDTDKDTVAFLKNFFSAHEKVELVEEDDADFYVNIFNGMIYFSMPEHEFQPLAKQILITEINEIETLLNEQLKAFIKWQHFYTLDNPGKDYETCPLKINVIKADDSKTDITNGTYTLTPKDTRLKSGEQYQELKMEIVNNSDEDLYVGVLTLGSDLSITSKPFDGIVEKIPRGGSKPFYGHQKKKSVFITVDHYKEVYNWKEDWFYYKIIFNNFEDFTAALQSPDYRQPELDPPLTIPTDRGVNRSAKGVVTEVEEVEKKWGTCRTRIELENSTYNIISGDLEEYAEQYAASTEIGPFIRELYFEENFNGKTIDLALKQNKDETAEEANRATSNVLVILMNGLYKSARRRKFNRQKHSDGPVVIAEGDSWFLYPKPGVRDTLDYIMEKFRLLSLAEAGDEIKDYLKNNELVAAVKKHKPKYVLISGGGNDILGPEIQTILRKDVQNGALATDFLDVDKFQEKLNFLSEGYKTFFEDLVKLEPGVRIFVHGYDYVRSNPDEKTIKKGWANKYMMAAGIDNAELRKIIIAHLVDSFNDLLKDLASQYPHVHYVNNRSTMLEDEWMDEIHPNNTGYQKVANNFLKAMET